jgi:hypothetical protein
MNNMTNEDADTVGLFIVDGPGRHETSSLDVVFVHGLGGSAKGTWTQSETNTFWPPWTRQLSRFENARILTFGYRWELDDAMESSNGLGIPTIAELLVTALSRHYSHCGDVHIRSPWNQLTE